MTHPLWHLTHNGAGLWRLTREGIPATRLSLPMEPRTPTEEMVLSRIVALLNAAEGVPTLSFEQEMEWIGERMEAE